MPNSLKCKIKHLCHNRTITESERDRILKALEQEPKFVIKSDGTIEQIKNCNDCLLRKEWEKIGKMLSAILEKQTEQKPFINKPCVSIGVCEHDKNKVLDELREEIRHFMFEVNPSSSESDYACNYILDLIDKHIGKNREDNLNG